MARRFYNNVTGTGTLSGAIGTSDTTVGTTGFTSTPSVPFTAVIDRGISAEEVVLVTANAGGSLTVQRGYDSTAASSHSAGAVIEHTIAAEGPNKWDAHTEETSDFHGISGTVVTTEDAQTVTDKTNQTSVYEGTNTTSPGAGPIHKATVNNTSRAGFSADTTGTGASGKAFQVVQSGSDKWRVNADGSVLVAPSGSPTWAEDVTGNQRVTGNQTVTGTSTVAGAASAASLALSGAITGATNVTASGTAQQATSTTTGNATVAGTLGVTGATTLTGAVTAGGNITAASGTVSAADLTATDDLTVGDDAAIAGTITAEAAKITTATVSANHTRVDTQAPVSGGSALRSARQPIVRTSIVAPGVASGWDAYSAVLGDFTWTQTETGNVQVHLIIQGQQGVAAGTAGTGTLNDMMVRLRTGAGVLLEELAGWAFNTVEFVGSARPIAQAVISICPADILTAGTSYKAEILGDRTAGGGSSITALIWTVTEVALV